MSVHHCVHLFTRFFAFFLVYDVSLVLWYCRTAFACLCLCVFMPELKANEGELGFTGDLGNGCFAVAKQRFACVA